MPNSTLTATPVADTSRVALSLYWPEQPSDPEPPPEPPPPPPYGPILAAQEVNEPQAGRLYSDGRDVVAVRQGFTLPLYTVFQIKYVRLYVGDGDPSGMRLRIKDGNDIKATAVNPVPADLPGYWLFTFPNVAALYNEQFGYFELWLDDAAAPMVAPIEFAYTTGDAVGVVGLRESLTTGIRYVNDVEGEGLPFNGSLAFYLHASIPPPADDQLGPVLPSVSRLDPDGVYRPVRAGNPVQLDGDRRWSVDDYDAPLDVPVSYVATNGVAGDDVATAGPVTLPSNGVAWLKHVGRPTLNQRVQLDAAPDLTRSANGALYPVLGRAAPVATTDTRSAGKGVISFHTETAAQTAAILALFADGSVLQLAMPGNSGVGSLFILPGDLTESRLTHYAAMPDRAWRLDFTVTERPY